MAGDKDAQNGRNQRQSGLGDVRPPPRVLSDWVALLANLAALTTFGVVIVSLFSSHLLLSQYESLYRAQIMAPVITKSVSNQIIVYFTTATAVAVLVPVFVSFLFALLFQGHIETLKGNSSITWPVWSYLFTVVAITTTLLLLWERGYVALAIVAILAAFIWIATVFGGVRKMIRTLLSSGSRGPKVLVVVITLVIVLFLVFPIPVVLKLIRMKTSGHAEIAVSIALLVATLMSLAGGVFRLVSGLDAYGVARAAAWVAGFTGLVAYAVADHEPRFVMAITGYGGFHIEYRLKGSKVFKRGALILQTSHALYLEPSPVSKAGRHRRLYEVRLTHVRWWGRSSTSKGASNGGRSLKESQEPRILLR